MSDPICRWRNPYLNTVEEIINWLPKEELPKQEAREIINDNFGTNFFHTAYQLAGQLGLYYETDGFFFPKFKHTPTRIEVELYMQNWITHYCIPNPYTRGFDNVESYSIHSVFCEKIFNQQNSIAFIDLVSEVLGDEIGNIDILKNSINTYSKVIRIHEGRLKLKENITYNMLSSYLEVEINQDRYNKEYFFDLFLLPSELKTTNLSRIPPETSSNQEEIDILTQIEESTLTITEKVQLAKARIGQGFFRRKLIENCKFCPITGVNENQLLIASHIKPWKSSNNYERLDVNNGLLLTPTYDKLFDKGFISFSNTKDLIISTKLSDENVTKLGLISNTRYPNLPIAGRENYMEYHRNEILK